MPNLSLSQALGGGQPSAEQQPSALAPSASADAGAGSIDPIDLQAVKYGWGPKQVLDMKAMRDGRAPQGSSMKQALAPVDPYQNAARVLSTGRR